MQIVVEIADTERIAEIDQWIILLRGRNIYILFENPEFFGRNGLKWREFSTKMQIPIM